MKRYIFFTVFCLPFILLNAQSVKRAYKSLEKYEYDKAKESFEKTLSEDKNNVAANLGLALIYADDESPLFNIIDAWQYVELIQEKTNQLSQDDIEVIGEYFLATEKRKTSRPVKKKIEIAIEAIQDRLIKYIREENNLEACYEVLERYPDFPHYDNVVHIRNQFEYRKYEKQNTIEAYEEFIVKFPDAAQVAKAKRNRDKLAFENTKKKNTTEAYNNYLKAYPNSEFKQIAIKLRNAAAYADAKRLNSIESYGSFVLMYPEALEVPEAKKMLRELMYKRAKALKTLEAYNDFINKYPDGNYYIDIFNLKSEELGKRYATELGLNQFQPSWVKAYDNNGQIDSEGFICSTNDGGYVLAATTRQNDTSYSDTWVIKIDATGNMIWNKTIGQAYDDKVIGVRTTSTDEIIVFGYTNMSTDSSSSMGWMYKLGMNGEKIWNKNLGKIEINAFDLSQKDRIYLSTIDLADTTKSNYYLQAFDIDGKKVWERSYIMQGSFSDLMFREDNSALLCGSGWIISVDEKFYIQWENILPQSSYNGICKTDAQQNNYIVTEDSLSTTAYKFNSTGNKTWQNQYVKSSSFASFRDIAILGDIFCFYMTPDGLLINKLSNSSGSLSDTRIIRENIFPDVYQKNNNTALLLSNNDLILLNINSMGF